MLGLVIDCTECFVELDHRTHVLKVKVQAVYISVELSFHEKTFLGPEMNLSRLDVW